MAVSKTCRIDNLLKVLCSKTSYISNKAVLFFGLLCLKAGE